MGSGFNRRAFFAPWRRFETPAPAPPPRFLRPPGALAENEFLSRCERCTACAEACPENAIVALTDEYGAATGTPAIFPRVAACALCDTLPCVSACEPGALIHVAREEVRMGCAELDESRCWAAMGQPCDYCFGVCPVRALGAGAQPVVAESVCVGCGLCEFICTSAPAALVVTDARRGPGAG